MATPLLPTLGPPPPDLDSIVLIELGQFSQGDGSRILVSPTEVIIQVRALGREAETSVPHEVLLAAIGEMTQRWGN